MKQLLPILFILLFIPPVFGQNTSRSFTDQNNISLNDLSLETDVSIFPNPAKHGKVTVKFNNQEITEIVLTNILGKEVLVKQFQIPVNEKQLDLNNIPDGIYLIRVKTSDNQAVVKKLMVSKN